MVRRTVADHIREQVTADLLDRLAKIADPRERLLAANAAASATTEMHKQLMKARGEAARAMAANGASWVSIGRELGVSGVRAKAITAERDRSKG